MGGPAVTAVGSLRSWRGWLAIAAAAFIAIAALALGVLPNLSGLGVGAPPRSLATGSPQETYPATPAPTGAIAAAPSPTSAPSNDALITIVSLPPHELRDAPWRLQLTLSGPAVFDLDGIDTFPTYAGEHVLTFWRNTCVDPLGCNSGRPRVLCTQPITITRGESLLVRIDVRMKPCIREIRPRHERPADPRWVRGQLLFANGGCPYLFDSDGHFWSLGLPQGWSTGFGSHSRVANAAGEKIGHRRDFVRVVGTRMGAYATECPSHILGNRAADYRITDMRIVRRAG
jgi:hypothetical protein